LILVEDLLPAILGSLHHDESPTRSSLDYCMLGAWPDSCFLLDFQWLQSTILVIG
jgi:hypothetical protein